VRALGLVAMLALAGCGPRASWMADESERISAVMNAEPFGPELPGAQGIAFAETPVMAAPFDSPRLELSNGRERRPGGGRKRLPPRSARRPRLAGPASSD